MSPDAGGRGHRAVITVELAPEIVADTARRMPEFELVYEPDLVAPYDSDVARKRARSPRSQAAFDAMVDSADVVLGIPDHSPAALAAAIRRRGRLSWVHTVAAGGGFQVRAAGLDDNELRRVAFTTSAGVHAQPLAEFALLGVLLGIKQFPRLLAAQRRHEWGHRRPLGLLQETTVAIVGLGHVGRRAAQLLEGLGATVIGVHRRDLRLEYVSRTYPVDQLGDALALSDAVVLALPATPATDDLLGASVLAGAKPGIVVVNVGRGSTIDEGALLAALNAGVVSAAVLDVTAVEPLPSDSALWDHPHMFISPHTAALSRDEPALVARLFAENSARWLQHEQLLNVVNTRDFY